MSLGPIIGEASSEEEHLKVCLVKYFIDESYRRQPWSSTHSDFHFKT